MDYLNLLIEFLPQVLNILLEINDFVIHKPLFLLQLAKFRL